jgi:protein-disulfide isomerase
MSGLRIPVGADDHAAGPADAPVTLVEYGDYQCPYCGAAHPVLKAVQKHFGARLRFVFRNFPITELHPHALEAAAAAEFAAVHGKFWPVHDGLYEFQTRLGMPLYERLVGAQGLSGDDLRAALAAGENIDRIQADFQGGVRSGVNGTPSFFINGRRHDDGADFDSLVAAIDEAIAAAKS